MSDVRVRTWRRFMRSIVGVAAITLALGSTSAAFAHEGEEEVPALELTQQAIAIIRSQPELMDEIEDRIADARESEDTEGVDLAKVEQAQEAFEEGDLTQTELPLEQAIGSCPGKPVVNPGGIRTPPSITTPCPAPGHLTALDRVPVGGTAQPVLLGLAALVILGGLFLVRRTHGHAG
jgi:hypothetical protein